MLKASTVSSITLLIDYTVCPNHLDDCYNFRGGLSQTTIKLVDAESGEELEEISEDIAHREVHPQAIYKRQDANGRMLTYQCISLDLNSKQAILKQTADSPLFTKKLEPI